jgi:glucose/arabinose dehydrogenase
VGVALPLVGLFFFGCGGDDSGAPGSTPIEGDASIGDATVDGSGGDASVGDGSSSDHFVPTDAPTTSADPCRGTALPAGSFFVPAGMCARVVANALGNTRQLTFAPNGDLFLANGDGTIKLLRDADKNGIYATNEIFTYANTGGNGNNAHIDGAFLYAGAPSGVRRWPYAAGMTSGGNGEDVVVNQPGDGNHPLHTTHVYDGYLYVHSGSQGNASDPISPAYDTGRSLIRRFKLSSFVPGTPFDWASGEIVSSGLRNMVGYRRNAAGRMFGVVNGLDDIHYGGQDVHNDNPGEQVPELAMGKQFGYPFCFTAQRVVNGGNVVAPGTQLENVDFGGVHDDTWCAQNSSPPATFVQAHSAPLDIEFFETTPMGALPEQWRGGAFIAFHGSWDRSPATGYKVVWMPFDNNGGPRMPTSTTTTTTFPYETVFGGGNASGPKDGPWSWSLGPNMLGDSPRPVGVAISPIDGALYISSNGGQGLIYRIGIQR